MITTNLAYRSDKYHIYPLTLSDEIEEIIVIRNCKGDDFAESPRVRNKELRIKYYCPPRFALHFPIFGLLFKFLMMTYLSIRERPDIVHGYLLFPHGLLAFVVGKLTRKKVGVSLIAGPVELYVLGGSPIKKYAYINFNPQKSLTSSILYYILKRFDFLTITGTFSKEFLLKKGIDKKKIFVIPHVIVDKIHTVSIKKEYDVLYVGRLSPIKHVETFIKSLSVVTENHPSIRAVIVGDGECKFKLESLARRLKLNRNIDFVGYRADIWNWYAKSKISILTSEREGFPYSILESLYLGVPVIASNCGDIQDVVKNRYNGLLIQDYSDYHSFADAINELIYKSPSSILNYSINSLNTKKNLSAETVALLWEEIFDKIN